VPVLFFKPQSALAGPGDEIFIPRIAAGEKVDYEVELCVVIGKDCKNVSEEEALNYVAGYTVANDLTSRGLSVKGIQWGMGKAFDCAALLLFASSSSSLTLFSLLTAWCPIGPVLVSPASLSKDIHDLEITTTVNGQTVQAGSTKDLVYKLVRFFPFFHFPFRL
jgi:2-keto-4-pentenoate hydratase/2-oxohepta-3-ene-1,7-dioic acid hydratase in catechol pathway